MPEPAPPSLNKPAPDGAQMLLPTERNDVFIAVQAAMLAVTRDDPAAAQGCLDIARDRLKAWAALRGMLRRHA